MFSADQVDKLTVLIAGENTGSSEPTAPVEGGDISFASQVLPIFQGYCNMCHSGGNAFGGWSGETYETVTTSGKNGPEIVPGDANSSRLVQLLQATNGVFMPPTGQLSDEDIKIITDWINAGAPNN
jgi:cytochrome c5